ncbi:hypothetical protein HGRIS_013785 [Hohenbuehelia grisea]|uniref:Mediator of RNA polymerase II transcription subunit 4 n=1 Tax=Hohenbuehelia grisea TaxID=104357 RepID=A0ABR3IWN8_9AGAR
MSSSHPPPPANALNSRNDEERAPESMTSILLGPLGGMNALAQSLFLSLGPPQSRPPPPPPIDVILGCDSALAEAVAMAHAHQVRQRRIDALLQEIEDLDARWREVCQGLEQDKTELEAILEEGEERIKAIAAAKASAVPYPDLLSYAARLSHFTSAPPYMSFQLMKQILLKKEEKVELFYPPFPNEEKIRRGRLNAEAPLGTLGETHPIKPKTASPAPGETTQAGAHAANPYRHDVGRPPPAQQIFDFDLDLNPDL